MENNCKFYFLGYELDETKNSKTDEDAKCSLLFTSVKAVSLFEALKEFEEYEIRHKKKCKLVKILEGSTENGTLENID